MQAGTRSVHEIFGQNLRLLVPLYQRPYVWSRKEQWEPLWDDIQDVADRVLAGQAVRAHFLGAVVLEEVGQPLGKPPTRLVIDGQQRLTTIQVLLEAFADLCAALGATDYVHVTRAMTRNTGPLIDSGGEERFKLWPTNLDREAFEKVMDATGPEGVLSVWPEGKGAPARPRLAEAYLYFHDAFAGWVGPASAPEMASRLKAMYLTLAESIRLVSIDLDGRGDDAQLIFETLNARGTPLLPADLVKNDLFHRAKQNGCDVNVLYSGYWAPFDKDSEYWRAEMGRGHAKRARIDTLLQHFMVLRTGAGVSAAHLYQAYRDHARDNPSAPPDEWLKALKRAADLFRRFDAMPRGTAEARFFDRLRDLEAGTLYPVLLHLYLSHGEQEDVVGGVLSMLESYLVRRTVCQLNTRGYGRLFIDLLQALRGKEDPVKAVRAFLLGHSSDSARWPDDAEFKTAWMSTPVYRVLQRHRVRMVLEAIALRLQHRKTEAVTIDAPLTIEHLMPVSWQEHWPLPSDAQADAALARDTLLHTFGNLTLATQALNTSLSNGPWPAKRNQLQSYTILALTSGAIAKPDWDEAAIQERGEILFETARSLWPKAS